MVLAVFQTLAGVFNYYATARITAELVRVIISDGDESRVWVWFAVVVVSSMLLATAYRVSQTLERKIYFSLTRWSSLAYAQHLAQIDIQDFDNTDTRNLINKLNQGFNWQLPNAAYFSLAIFQSIFNLLVTAATIGTFAWWLLPIFVVLLIPMLLYETRVQKVGWFVFTTEGDGQHLFWGSMGIFQDVKKQFELRALGATRFFYSLLDKLTTKFYNKQIKIVNGLNKFAALAVVSQFLRESVAQGWLIMQVLAKNMSIDSYLFYTTMIFRLDGAISGTFSTLAQMQDGLRFSIDFKSFLDIKPKINDKENAIKLDNAIPKIEFDDVTFSYPGSKKQVFKNLSLVIEPGEKLALVGMNGAGKSTFIKLLLRFYVPDSGRILINGYDLNDINIESFLHQLAVLFQDFNKYVLTARDNISVSTSKSVDSMIREAAKLSGADSVIENLPDRYDTYLSPSMRSGVELSGGQWQKIALARAFYRKANLIILDEPTSAIDAKSEADIFNNIFKEHDGRSAIIVSHRFSTVRKADKIVVFDKGKITERGSHNDLLEAGGLYAEMFNKQAEGYR